MRISRPSLQLIIIPLLLFMLSCGNRKLGTPTGIVVQINSPANINYGQYIKLSTFLTYDSGKRKDISTKDGLSISVLGAEKIKNNLVFIDPYPTSFQNDSLFIFAHYEKGEMSFEYELKVPYNYKGDLTLDFNGDQGEEGEVGASGGTALLFRYGKDGDEGFMGGEGTKGHDLSIHVYKDIDTYYMRIVDLETSEIFYYKNKDNGFPIYINSIGGQGGNGGEGGDGGNGKDGKKTEKKTKDCGAGGDGGSGGNGGPGGQGGTVHLYIHPTADGFQKRLTIVNTGGPGGNGGIGGNGGRAGTPLEGQEACEDGEKGYEGDAGQIGMAGPTLTISVEEFDIDF